MGYIIDKKERKQQENKITEINKEIKRNKVVLNYY